MNSIRHKKDPIELSDLILKHDPDATSQQIAEVISEWGNLFDDQKFLPNESIGVEGDAKSESPHRT
jgi:hypothetical protein